MNLKRTLSIILIVFTFNAIGQQNENFKNINKPSSPFDFTQPNYDHYVINSKDQYFKNWNLELNIDLLRQNKLLNIFNKYNFIFSHNIKFNFNSDIPLGINKITLSGNTKKHSQDVYLYIYGDVSDEVIINFINEKVYTVDSKPQLRQKKSIPIKNTEIYVFEFIDNNEKNKKRYLAQLAQGFFLFSSNLRDLNEILRRPIKKEKPKKQPINENLISLYFNNEVIMKNAENNIDDEDQVMKSQLFNKTEKLLASISILESYVVLNSTIKTKSSNSASQIEKIINGIIAVKSINNEDSKTKQSQLLNNFVINTNKKDVYFRTFLPLKDLQSYK